MSLIPSRHDRQQWSPASSSPSSPAQPEERLWRAVIDLAFRDAVKGASVWYGARTRRQMETYQSRLRDEARSWLLDGGRHFVMVCDLAGRDPSEVRDQARKILSDPEAMRQFVAAGKTVGRGRRRSRVKSSRKVKKGLEKRAN